MEKENVLLEKSYGFALMIVRIYLYMQKDLKEYELSRQLLKCGTSIGANAEEAVGAQSRKDFISKMSISYKEARETHFFLRLLRDSDILQKNILLKLIGSCEELLKIITSILNTSKRNI
ncbi:MAG: four helix bundle protein [Bacteroidota bacterium]|nr:four helix bundle protein [Bacteroidota bacterium]